MLAVDRKADRKAEEWLAVVCATVLLALAGVIETAEGVVEVGCSERLVVIAVIGTSRNQAREKLHGRPRHSTTLRHRGPALRESGLGAE